MLQPFVFAACSTKLAGDVPIILAKFVSLFVRQSACNNSRTAEDIFMRLVIGKFRVIFYITIRINNK
jgi:hypothetical protein